MAQHKVATYHQQGIIKKLPGFGHPTKQDKYLNQPGCLTDSKTYHQELSLSAGPVPFSDIKTKGEHFLSRYIVNAIYCII